MAMYVHKLSNLPEEIIELLEEAKKISNNAYNKYSNYFVGAAVRTTSGKIYSGTFIENASFGLTICAEPAAILNANTHGDFQIETIAIVGGDGKRTNPPVTPCGRCRQIIFEASLVNGKDIDIYCSNLELSEILVSTIYELLPLPFNR
jgi:cytidine deaminase